MGVLVSRAGRKFHGQRQLGKGRGYFILQLVVLQAGREVRAESQGQSLGTGTEAEARRNEATTLTHTDACICTHMLTCMQINKLNLKKMLEEETQNPKFSLLNSFLQFPQITLFIQTAIDLKYSN